MRNSVAAREAIMLLDVEEDFKVLLVLSIASGPMFLVNVEVCDDIIVDSSLLSPSFSVPCLLESWLLSGLG